MSIYETINRLKQEYSSEADKEIIGNWERELYELAPKIELAQIQPIKELLERMVTKVRNNKNQLSEDAELNRQQRDALMAENKVYNELINFFASANNYAKYLAETIKEAEKSLK